MCIFVSMFAFHKGCIFLEVYRKSVYYIKSKALSPELDFVSCQNFPILCVVGENFLTCLSHSGRSSCLQALRHYLSLSVYTDGFSLVNVILGNAFFPIDFINTLPSLTGFSLCQHLLIWNF